MDDAAPHRHESARQDLANLLLHTAVNVSRTADLLGRLARAIPPTTQHTATTIADVRQAVALIHRARQQLIASADTLIELDKPTRRPEPAPPDGRCAGNP